MSNEVDTEQSLTVSFIGAGNVATHLSKALVEAGCRIVGVHTRSRRSAEELANRYDSRVAEKLEDLPESDFYIFSIKDDALEEKVAAFGKLQRKGLCLHTAGSVSVDVFRGKVSHYGVLYPLQTFSKKREIDFSDIPLFIEASSEADLSRLSILAHQISQTVIPLSSESRKQLHLAAVFACNFSNHCFAIAGEILGKANLSAALLNPLIQETCNKLNELPAIKGQTGPAVRYDQKVMSNHLDLLGSDCLRKEIYKLMSESIHEYATQHSDQ